MNKDNFVLLDIETNVEENMPMEDHFHVIQIGATKITNGDFKNYQTFSKYIRPVEVSQYPAAGGQLTGFIKKLTKIKQVEVDLADTFPDTWEQFLRFCEPYFEFFVSWGYYDWEVLKRVCDYYNLNFPFRYHVNLKDYYKAYFKDQDTAIGMGVKRASEYFELPYNDEGAHNGLEDAKMITAIAEKMSERGFYTFKKAHYEFKDEKIVPCFYSPYFASPVLIKKYKEIQKKGKEMERYLFNVSKKNWL